MLPVAVSVVGGPRIRLNRLMNRSIVSNRIHFNDLKEDSGATLSGRFHDVSMTFKTFS